MSGIETRFGVDHDAERIRTAFYGFLDQHASDAAGDARIRMEINSDGPHLLVRLWSAEATDAFLRTLSSGEPLSLERP